MKFAYLSTSHTMEEIFLCLNASEKAAINESSGSEASVVGSEGGE